MQLPFAKFAGMCAVLAGIAEFLYAVAFVIVGPYAPESGQFLSALFLMLGPLLATAALVALYQSLKETDEGVALWALVLSVAGAIGAAIHGGYDLANAIHPVNAVPANVASQIDPRGLLTFGVAGVSMAVIAWLMRRGDRFPRGLGALGYLFAILLFLLYLGRLIILDPTAPAIVIPALLAGFLVGPVWYVWLGLVFLRGRP